ncbi:MAG: TVP38/TMEM64 family protein [Pararhodobacter sp.]|nr:TVP38/TMEM64 family protein [Pararhodobacter sp.]
MGRYLPLAVVVCAAIIGWYLLGDHLGFESLRANRELLIAFRDAHMAWAVLLFMLGYVAVVAFSLPGGTLATLTGGFLFGLFPGALMNVTAATIGAVIIFSVVRAGLGARLAARIDAGDGRVKRISDQIRANEVPVLLGMRLLPVLPFFVANVIPAFLGVALARYAWTTFVGIFPGGVVYTWVGAGLGEVFDRGETPDLGVIFEPQIIGPILALAALALMPMVWRLARRA